MKHSVRIGVVMPAVDEEEAVPLVLAELPHDRIDHIVLVDNGSIDRTAAVAKAGGAIVIHEPIRGYGQACFTGLTYLFDLPYDDTDIIVFLDADHSDYPEELPLVIAPILEQRADMVIGSRILGGADMSALLPQAWFGNRLACFLLRWLFGARYTDLGPFRAIRVDALRQLNMRDRGFGWTIEMQLKAHTQGLRIAEVPVRYRERVGTSKITGTVSGTVRAGWKILSWIFAWRVRSWFSA